MPTTRVRGFLLHILAGLLALFTASAAVLPDGEPPVSKLDARALSSVQMTFVGPGTPFDGYVAEFVWPYGTIWVNRTASPQYAYVDYSLTDSGVLTGHGTKLCLRAADNARSSYLVVDPTVFTPRTECTGDDFSWGIYRGAYLTWGGGYDQFCILANSQGDALLIWVPGTPSYESGSNGRCAYRGRVSINGADLQTEPPTPVQPTKTMPTGSSTTSTPGGPTTTPPPSKPNPAVIAAVAAAAAAYSKASSAVSSYAANATNSAMADNADSTIDTAIAAAQDAQSVANDQVAPNVATDLSNLSDTLFDAAARAAIALTLLSAAAASALTTAFGPAAAAVAAAQAKAQDPSQNPSPTSSPPTTTSTSSSSSTPFTCTVCIACDDANLDGEPTTGDDAADINENKRDLGQHGLQDPDLDARTMDLIYEEILGNGLGNVESFLKERNISHPDPSILLEDFDLDYDNNHDVDFDEADWDLVMRNLEENFAGEITADELEERADLSALAGGGRGMLCSSMFDVPTYDSWSSTGTNSYSLYYNYVQPGPNCQARAAVPFNILSARTTSAFPIPNGYQIANNRYATEHIYEIQQVAQFFNWAWQNDNFMKTQGDFCATTGLGYLMKTKPAGGSPPWSTYGDFDYTIAPIQNFFNQLPGAGGNRNEFVYLEAKTNGVKGVLFNQPRKPRVLASSAGQVPQAARIVAVGKYLQDSGIVRIYKLVSGRIREIVDDFETACKQATDSRFAKYANVDFVGLYDTWERQFLSSVTSKMKLQAKLNADLAYITAKRQALRGSTQARAAYRNLAKKVKIISQGINGIDASSLTRPTAAPTRRN